MAEPPAAARPGPGQISLSVTFNDRAALASAYMPFLKNGGLFIPTAQKYRLGDEIFVLLTLMDEPEKFYFSGQVTWITPPGAQANRAAGIGVQFAEPGAERLRSRIEFYLTGLKGGSRDTYTM